MEDHIKALKDAEKSVDVDDTYGASERTVKPHQDDASLMTGIVLIVVGGLFLLNTLNGFVLNNWWALFILIPALKNLSSTWRSFQRHGRFTHASRGSLIGGLILSLVSLTFLFNLSWGMIWPIFLIIIGFGSILTAKFG